LSRAFFEKILIFFISACKTITYELKFFVSFLWAAGDKKSFLIFLDKHTGKLYHIPDIRKMIRNTFWTLGEWDKTLKYKKIKEKRKKIK